jgi:LmbE family N-acetylglucosaminyl deacetylase
MKKVLVSIFAHPDDESFGPAATLIKETRAGTELHLVSLTLGDAGMNPDSHDDLAEVREKEWHAAGKLLGATSQHYLGYKDGMLCNQSMIEIGEKLVELITDLTKHASDDIEIELLTGDFNGISGHIDHIVAARAAAWAFYTLKKTDKRITRLRLICIPRSFMPEPNVNWLYMEAGRSDEEISETIDGRDVYDDVVAIMRAHHSQRSDCETHIKNRGENVAVNYFIVLS